MVQMVIIIERYGPASFNHIEGRTFGLWPFVFMPPETEFRGHLVFGLSVCLW